eukprot:scaffold14005_cov177-Isochrysis_galbana.AAC.2
MTVGSWSQISNKRRHMQWLIQKGSSTKGKWQKNEVHPRCAVRERPVECEGEKRNCSAVQSAGWQCAVHRLTHSRRELLGPPLALALRLLLKPSEVM